jgi:hypothetical protein
MGKVPARSREKTLREAGEDFGRSLATAASLKASGNVRTGLQRVCDALGSLGFQASLLSIEGDSAILETATCPLRPLVVKWPEATGIDQGMWAGLVERGVRGVSAGVVECETPQCRSAEVPCSVRLSLGHQERKASGRNPS